MQDRFESGCYDFGDDLENKITAADGSVISEIASFRCFRDQSYEKWYSDPLRAFHF